MDLVRHIILQVIIEEAVEAGKTGCVANDLRETQWMCHSFLAAVMPPLQTG
jgi:hypothetical protein